MAYYMLMRGGLDEKRFERIEGYADRRLKTPASRRPRKTAASKSCCGRISHEGVARLACGFVACALTLAASASAEETGSSPVQLVDNLQSLQAAIAQGDTAAYAAQPKLLREIADAFSAAKPEVWQNSRNARAAVIYLLSGGQPRVVIRLIEGGGVSKDDEKLMRGAIAYELGHETRSAEAAWRDGSEIPRTDAGRSGRLRAIDAADDARSDKAVGLLDLARLLSPGGLVEEAALRREVVLLGRNRAQRRQVHGAGDRVYEPLPEIALRRQFPQDLRGVAAAPPARRGRREFLANSRR